jgi:hypothetical protein
MISVDDVTANDVTSFAVVLSLAITSASSARGAPLGDVLWATAVAVGLSAAMLWVAAAHRDGRISWLGRAADSVGRATGLPGWSILPIAVAGSSLLIAVVGFYWDVAKHIDTGRDAGPFGTVAHYPILVGLAGITLGGFLAIVLGAPQDVPTSIRLTRSWRAPLGGVLIFVCGGLALLGFPLDDVWHTLFGQDVTLWGPTHILMVGGASLSTLGLWVLLIEGRRVSGGAPPAWVSGVRARLVGGPLGAIGFPRLQRLALSAFAAVSGRSMRLRGLVLWGFDVLPGWFLALGEVLCAGAFLIGLSTLQGEFDYGVPQFQLLYQPILIALAAGAGLVAARVRLGRGAALGATLFYCLVFGLLSVWVGPVLGLSTLHFPLYIAEAVLVEVAALALVPARRPLLFAACSGLLIGTVGTAAEWWWSHRWMPLPWPSSMLGPVAIFAPLAGLAGGVIGAFIGGALRGGELGGPVLGPGGRRWALPLAAAAAIACIAYPLPMNAGAPASVTASLTTLSGHGATRDVAATFRLRPASTAEGSEWVQVIDWQGGGLVVDRLRRVAPGVYRTTRPIPVGGKWKAILRVSNGRSLRGVPIYLPADPGIPARGIPASAHFTRPFQREKRILQREAIGGPAGLDTVAYLLLVAIVGGWFAALVWGMGRLQSSSGRRGTAPADGPSRVAVA